MQVENILKEYDTEHKFNVKINKYSYTLFFTCLLLVSLYIVFKMPSIVNVCISVVYILLNNHQNIVDNTIILKEVFVTKF